MAGSLDELILFLLDEIALSGQQGSTPADVLASINRFSNSLDKYAVDPDCEPGQARRVRRYVIDRAFQNQVWRWLTQHPDVYVGKDRRGNKMPLSAVEAQHSTKEAEATPAMRRDSSSSGTSLGRNSPQYQTPPSASPFKTTTAGSGLRVYASEERVWVAICGHSKDLTKLFDTEFALLSIIAAHREAGILQGDLVKQSRQDKRSVPKRTDLLQSKGYIEKRTVHLKGLKTSRLMLRRFASNFSHDMVMSSSVSVGPRENVQDESVDYDVLIQRLFALLRHKQIVTRDDLKNELEMASKWRARVLAKVVRKFEAVGCLKRVKAASEASKKARYYFYCVKLIHEPSPLDLDAFHSFDAGSNFENAVEEPGLEDEDDADKTMVEQALVGDGKRLEEVGRIVPQWNPDRSLANVLLNLVQDAGTQGLGNRELRQLITGTFVRRPLEHLLTRLTTLQLQSQPPHLRHLAIVRDTVLSGTIPLYVQYSLPNFEARVLTGRAFWEALKTPVDCSRRERNTSSKVAPVDLTKPIFDEFGFPAKYTPSSQYKGGRTTLGQGLLAARPESLLFSRRDPMFSGDGSIKRRVKYNTSERTINSVRPATQEGITGRVSCSVPPETGSVKHPVRSVQTMPRPKGRPRKFLQGTEKFWQEQFAMARTLANKDGHKNSSSKAGVMSDPAGLSLFAMRPSQFDLTLVKALERGLPVPATPKDITQEWVDKTSQVLNRAVSSVCVTPKGVQFLGPRKHTGASRILIIRSSRLGNLRFLKRREGPAVRFLASSAAHTFADVRFEFLGETVCDSDNDTCASSSSSTRAQSTPTDPKIFARGKQVMPRHPISHIPGSTEFDTNLEANEANPALSSPGTKRRSRPQKLVQTPKTVTASPPKRASTPKRRESVSILEQPVASSTKSFGLPPPLTTRSALRKRQGTTQGTSTGNEFSRAVFSAIDEQDDGPAPNLLESTTSQSEPKFSSHLNNIPVLEGNGKANVPSEAQLALIVDDAPNTLSNSANNYGARRETSDVSEQAPRQMESTAPSLRSPSLKLLTTPPRRTGVSKERLMSRTKPSPLGTLNEGDHNSEAFRLVQELMVNETEHAEQVGEAIAADDSQQKVSPVAFSEPNEDASQPRLKVSDEDSDQETPRKRGKKNVVGAGSVAILRRKIVLDLLEACGGALPYYSKSLWGPFTTAWQKAGQSGKPDMRTIKAAVKSLCQNGSAKQIKFSHRNKRDVMVTKTIIAKPNIAASSEIILEAQKKMIEADPRSYLPEALEVDSEFKRDVERQRSTPWPAVFEEETVQSSVIPAKVLRLQLRETLSCARKRRLSTNTAAGGANKARDQQNGSAVPRSRPGSIRRKYTRRSESYQRPKLSMDQYPWPPQPQNWHRSATSPKPLDFGIEMPVVPLVSGAFTPQGSRKSKSQTPIPSDRGQDASQPSSLSSTPNAQLLESVPITWRRIGGQPNLPSSLEDILRDDHRRNKPDRIQRGDVNTRSFDWIIDEVASWELRSPDIVDFRSTNWVFINHSVGDAFRAAPAAVSGVVFDGLIWYDQRGREHTEKRFHAFDKNIHAIPVKEKCAGSRRERRKADGQTQAELIAPRPSNRRKRVSVDAAEPAKKRRRGKSPLTQPQTIRDPAGTLVDVSHLIGAKYKRPRGIQHLRTMPEHLIYKLSLTVVVIRALAGGLEKHVDWPLVMSVFPDDDEQFLKDRWKTLSNKHRRDIDQLSENFQDRFPEAYAQGEVQRINFDDLENVDWENIVQWALNNLDKRIMHNIPELPANMSELDETVNMKIEHGHRPYRDLFGYNQAVTVPMKEAAISAIPFAVPLALTSAANPSDPPDLLDSTAEARDPTSTLAKSWALSTITTPLHTFDAAKAHKKLQSLTPRASESEALVASAMKSLSSAKAVSKKRDKGTDAKGRSYDLSRLFTDTLDQRRFINAAMLKQAVQYKTAVLDPAFSKGDTMKFQPVTVEDGDMVAILNLCAHGKIKVKIGPDVPRNRWGIDQDSQYRTRNIKKETLYFTVLMQQVPGEYVFGNPLLQQDVRMPDLGKGNRDLIPIWRDIHGGFQRGSWDLALAALLGILATRPGASARELMKTLSPVLELWEVESLLAWCSKICAVQKTGQDEEGGWTGGWEVREWWWMVLDCGMALEVPSGLS